jgi:hypothetical protein
MAAINRCRTYLTGLTNGLARPVNYTAPDGRCRNVSELYAKLDKLRKLYGSESIEEIVDDVIAWRLRFNRLVELQNKVMVSEADYDEMRAIQQEFRHDLARQRARRLRVQVVGS